jgi:hypothetical protein
MGRRFQFLVGSVVVNWQISPGSWVSSSGITSLINIKILCVCQLVLRMYNNHHMGIGDLNLHTMGLPAGF